MPESYPGGKLFEQWDKDNLVTKHSKLKIIYLLFIVLLICYLVYINQNKAVITSALAITTPGPLGTGSDTTPFPLSVKTLPRNSWYTVLVKPFSGTVDGVDYLTSILKSSSASIYLSEGSAEDNESIIFGGSSVLLDTFSSISIFPNMSFDPSIGRVRSDTIQILWNTQNEANREAFTVEIYRKDKNYLLMIIILFIISLLLKSII